MGITKKEFGTSKDGQQVYEYTLKNHNGMEVKFLNLGAVITEIIVPDRDGVFENVVLGYDDLKFYEDNKTSFGAFIGRYANRIGEGKFVLNGKEYKVDQNEGTNCLHGGFVRYNECMYDVSCEESAEEDRISFTRLSPDGEQGCPGNLTMTVTYTVNDNDELMIEYYAVSDADTIINVTNHSYFNLGKGGHKCKDILEQEIQIESDQYTPVDDILIPLGTFSDVEGTGLDFREFRTVKSGIGQTDKEGKVIDGFDHNFVIRDSDVVTVRKAAQFRANDSGRLMEVYTDQPGMQLYTANTLDEPNGKDGTHYGNFAAACFETQNYPNAINTEGFPSAVLKAGEEYESVTVYSFKTF